MNDNYRSFFIEYDYYSGGMVMPDRNFSYENYGFGFNGKPKDDEVKGEANHYDYGARIYDPRLNRWLSLDPLFRDYPSLSGYSAMGNNAVWIVDDDGRKIRIVYLDKEGTLQSYDYRSNLELPNNEYVRSTVKALNHLSLHNVGTADDAKSVIDDLTYSTSNDVFIFDGVSNILETGGVSLTPMNGVNRYLVNWDPAIGALLIDNQFNSTGEKQSPSTILIHELNHAINELKYPGAMQVLADIDDQWYGNLLERYTTTGIETDVAKFFKEGVRTNRFPVKGYITIDPTTTQEAVSTINMGSEIILNKSTSNYSW